jgi:hypothetical protein
MPAFPGVIILLILSPFRDLSGLFGYVRNPQKPKIHMNKKHVVIALLVGAALGYVAQNYIRKIPVVNKLPVLG